MNLDEMEIVKKYIDGNSLNAIAKEFHTYPMTISRILTQHKVELRHDKKEKGAACVTQGEKLLKYIEEKKAPATKSELAAFLGKSRLSPSYFKKYPELGQLVKTYDQKELKPYYDALYKFLKDNNIPYKPNDKTLIGTNLDVILLGDYYGIALQIIIKPMYVSKKKHIQSMIEKSHRAADAGVILLMLQKEHFENLGAVKYIINDCREHKLNNIVENSAKIGGKQNGRSNALRKRKKGTKTISNNKR